MQKAKLIQKRNSVICSVATPPANNTRQWSEVLGVIMEADSQENINTWWDVFTEIADGCPDWRRGKRQRRKHTYAES